MSLAKYTIHWVLGTYDGDIIVYADEDEDREQVLWKAKRLHRRDFGPRPLGLYAESWRITDVEPVRDDNPRRRGKQKKKLSSREVDVLMSLEAAALDFWELPPEEQTRQYFKSDGPDYEAANRLVKRRLADLQGSGVTGGTPWILISLNDNGLQALKKAVPNPHERRRRCGSLLIATRNPNGAAVVLPVDGIEVVGGVLVVHPSIRNIFEVVGAARRQPSSWSITHLPSGQLVATVEGRGWAVKLANEILSFAGEGIRSIDPRVVALAIGGPDFMRARYLLDVQRMATQGGRFPSFHSWREQHKGMRLQNAPKDVAAAAALQAAVGSLVGGILGAIGGAVVLGVVGGTLGAAVGGAGLGGGGAVAGAIFGIPIGGFVGTIWGAVRQTGKALRGYEREQHTAKLLAGVGAGVAGPLSPLGAGLGAYLGAMD